MLMLASDLRTIVSSVIGFQNVKAICHRLTVRYLLFCQSRLCNVRELDP